MRSAYAAIDFGYLSRGGNHDNDFAANCNAEPDHNRCRYLDSFARSRGSLSQSSDNFRDESMQ